MNETTESQRLDRWLWYTRLFKTRSLAGKTVVERGARITRHGQTQHTEKASIAVRVGDVIALTKGNHALIVEVVALGERRGPAPEAQTLYKDHSPPLLPRPEKPEIPFKREAGTGRPTKKDRRDLEAVQMAPFFDGPNDMANKEE